MTATIALIIKTFSRNINSILVFATRANNFATKGTTHPKGKLLDLLSAIVTNLIAKPNA